MKEKIVMNVPFYPTLCTILIVLSAILVTIGWSLIRRKKVEAHKKVMLAATVCAVLFLIIYVTRTILVGNTSFGGPDHLKIYYTVFLVFHIILAMGSAVMGIITIRAALKNNLKLHRKIGPVTAIMWILTAITGVAVYLLLYIFFKGGEITSVFKAILGI